MRRASSLAALVSVVLIACSSSDPGTGDTTDSGTTGADGGGPVADDGGPGAVDSTAPDAAPPDAGPAGCGRNTTPCGPGGMCDGPPDCLDGVCRSNVCQAAAPGDGVKNGDETDVDCGGTKAPACVDGKHCLVADDCTSMVCDPGTKTCSAPSPTDGVKNGDETDVDCGGTKAPKCATGKGCKTTADCDAVACDPVTKTCAAPSHTDNIKNDGETGVDCGGAAPTKCPPGQGCATDGDCDNTRCNAGTKVCDPATSTDGLKNGTETDVDCGGGAPTNAPKCALTKTCGADTDCASSACSYAKKCVTARSCKVQHGGDTCGPTGTDDCCTTIDMPGAPGGGVKLDKYNITAGRFRAFVEATGGNLRGYIQANTPAWWDATWTSKIPYTLDNGQTNPDDNPAYSGVYQELGPYVHGTAQGANEGCFVNGYGARTYRIPDPVNTRMKDQQYYDQNFLDDRPLVCVTAYMVAAFCAWDGGKMPTRYQVDYAWGAAKYPWGTAAPAGYDQAYGVDPKGTFGRESYGGFQTGPFVNAPFALTDVQYANYNYNYWGGASVSSTDYSIFIAPPGRFPNGNGPYGHSDLAGNVFDSTDIVGTGVYWSRSGSWQGHNIPWTNPGNWLHVSASNKYWAMGGRCAR